MSSRLELTPKQDRRNLQLTLGQVSTWRDLYLLTLRKVGMTQAPEPQIPPWVQKCYDGFWQASYSHAPVFKVSGEGNMREKGTIVGFILWWQRSLNKCNESLEKLSAIKPLPLSVASQKKIEAAWDKMLVIDGLVTEKDIAEVEELSEAKPDLTEALTIGPTVDIVQFSEGLGIGLKGPSRTEDGELNETDATAIYTLLFLYWRQIIEFQSVTQLHQVLTRILGASRVGEKKRIEQICRRIGLRFRGRGRPKKSFRPARG